MAGEPVIRPRGLSGRFMHLTSHLMPIVFSMLRRIKPIAKFGSLHIVTLHDDVREVLTNDPVFMVGYKKNLDVILDGQPVFVGMRDTPEYRGQLERLRSITPRQDLPQLAARAEAQAEKIVSAAEGSIEVIDALVRTVTFDVLREYIGISEPHDGDLRIWSTRLFEFLFMPVEKSFRAEIEAIGAAMRKHVDADIAHRMEQPGERTDLVGRAVGAMTDGNPGWNALEIRTLLMSIMFGGPPQPPMALPCALNQLLKRPEALAGAAEAAKAAKAAQKPDDPKLLGYLLEALRFDPITPFLARSATLDTTIALGTGRDHAVRSGQRVWAAVQSAMIDPGRIPDPKRFNPERRSYEYMLFGHGLHQCFGEHINRAMFPAIMGPLLRRPGLRRASGARGRLAYEGLFPSTLWVEFD